MTNSCIGIYAFEEEKKSLFSKIVKPIVETHVGLAYLDAMSQYESKSVKMDLIYNMISESSLAIVDISIKNANVFFELGIAYTLKKPIILICSNESFKSKKVWDKNFPFDIRTKDILIFQDESDLRVKLGVFISDAIHKTALTTVSWVSESKRNHIKSSSNIELFEKGNVWSNKAINNNFTLSYKVTIKNLNSVPKPDIRLFISYKQSGFPRIVVIFPWEFKEINPNRYECHIDYFLDEKSENEKRLQQVAASESIETFNVFLSFCWPNIVFESTIFDIDRLVIPLNYFQNMGYPIHLNQFIGFEAFNPLNVEISEINIKEVFI